MMLDLLSYGTPSIAEISHDLKAITTPFFIHGVQTLIGKTMEKVTSMAQQTEVKGSQIRSYLYANYPNTNEYNRELLFAHHVLNSSPEKNLL